MVPILALIAALVAFGLGYLLGRSRAGARAVEPIPTTIPAPDEALPATIDVAPPAAEAPVASAPPAAANASAGAAVAERARLVRSYASEAAALRAVVAANGEEIARLRALAAERDRVESELAAARAEAARYRQFVIDLENNAPPPLLGGPGAPDDLKLIVGVGPVLERMLFALGITTYRQIGRWNERDIDEFDAKLAEFPGRIRRDGWVTQARALHQSKYGAALPPR